MAPATSMPKWSYWEACPLLPCIDSLFARIAETRKHNRASLAKLANFRHAHTFQRAPKRWDCWSCDWQYRCKSVFSENHMLLLSLPSWRLTIPIATIGQSFSREWPVWTEDIVFHILHHLFLASQWFGITCYRGDSDFFWGHFEAQNTQIKRLFLSPLKNSLQAKKEHLSIEPILRKSSSWAYS